MKKSFLFSIWLILQYMYVIYFYFHVLHRRCGRNKLRGIWCPRWHIWHQRFHRVTPIMIRFIKPYCLEVMCILGPEKIALQKIPVRGTSVRPNFGIGIRYRLIVLVSVSELKFYLPKPKLFFPFFLSFNFSLLSYQEPKNLLGFHNYG